MPIGPALPPHLAHLSGQSSNKEEESGPAIPRSTTPEDDDDYVPALPPHLAAARQARTAGPALGPSIPSSAAGPSRSPQRSPHRPQPPVGDDDSDDDVIGPVLSGGPVVEKSAVEEFREREERWAKQREEASKPKKQERESWMLVPPSSGVLSTVDPLRKRPTTFNKASKPVDTDSSIWTETPAEKAQRIADEVAGIKRKKEPQSGSKRDEDEDELRRKRIKESEIKKSIDKHNQEQRGGSLLDQHTKNKKDGKDEPAAIWDRDRDMGVTGRLLSDQERQAKIKEARGLNDRFGHSKRGAFDI